MLSARLRSSAFVLVHVPGALGLGCAQGLGPGDSAGDSRGAAEATGIAAESVGVWESTGSGALASGSTSPASGSGWGGSTGTAGSSSGIATTGSMDGGASDATLDGGADSEATGDSTDSGGECDPPVTEQCGNGSVQRELGESCDGTQLEGQTCQSLGFAAGELACSRCCTFDATACLTCGNGKRDGDEECDGADLGGVKTCGDLGLDNPGAELRCTSDCRFDRSPCEAIEPVERCGERQWPITDTSSVSDTIKFEGIEGRVRTATVVLKVQHERVGDLDIRLAHFIPDGRREVELYAETHERPCDGSDIDVVLTDEGLTSVDFACDSQASPALEGRLSPIHSLELGFRELPVEGAWVLEIDDQLPEHDGRLLQWCLQLVIDAPK